MSTHELTASPALRSTGPVGGMRARWVCVSNLSRDPRGRAGLSRFLETLGAPEGAVYSWGNYAFVFFPSSELAERACSASGVPADPPLVEHVRDKLTIAPVSNEVRGGPLSSIVKRASDLLMVFMDLCSTGTNCLFRATGVVERRLRLSRSLRMLLAQLSALPSALSPESALPQLETPSQLPLARLLSRDVIIKLWVLPPRSTTTPTLMAWKPARDS